MELPANPSDMLQLVVTAVLPYPLQGLKRIKWCDDNSDWFMPIIAMVIGALFALYMEITSWLIVGILSGLSAGKAYDLMSKTKHAKFYNFISGKPKV